MQLGPTVMQQLTSGSDLDRAAVPGPPPTPTPHLTSLAGEPVTSAGSDFDKASTGQPWPMIIDGAVKFFNRARPSNLTQVHHQNVPGNYGMVSSLANFLFRGSWVQSDEGNMGVGLYPGPVPYAKRPMYDVLTPIVWGLTVIDKKQWAQMEELNQYQQLQVAPMQYTAPGSASLQPQLL